MAIDFDAPVFPTVFIDAFSSKIAALDPRISVFTRRISTEDPAISVGIFGDSWAPKRETAEIMGGGFMGMHEPTINSYSVTVEGLIIDSTPETGLARHYALANVLRTALAWDEELGVSLSETATVIVDGYQETLRKWYSGDQTYYSADLSPSKWAYLSILEITLETETRRI